MRHLKAPLVLLAGVVLVIPFRMAGSINPPTPIYTTASIVNAASYSADALAPNTIASIYGLNLAFSTQALTTATMTDGGLPFSLNGVTVYVSGLAVGLYFVSPKQINFLLPSILLPGTYPLSVVRDGFAGARVPITVVAAGPALFADEIGNVIAQHLDGSLVSPSTPAAPGEWVVIYALGLGLTVPEADIYRPADAPAPIENIAQFALLVNGAAVPPKSIYYAGITPGFAGLYQINVQLPKDAPPTPQIRISIGSAVSAGQTQLPVV